MNNSSFVKRINHALARGNEAKEILDVKEQDIIILTKEIENQHIIIENNKKVISNKDVELGIVQVQVKVANESALKAMEDKKRFENLYYKEQNRKKVWRTVGISVSVGLAAFIYFLK